MSSKICGEFLNEFPSTLFLDITIELFEIVNEGVLLSKKNVVNSFSNNTLNLLSNFDMSCPVIDA